MSRSSTMTVRATPVQGVTSVSGAMTVHGQTFEIETHQRIQIIDLTDQVMAHVRATGLREGIISLFSNHTTCTLFINEFQAALVSDMKRFLEEIIDGKAEWLHDDPSHSDCERANADSHLRALLLGHSLNLQLSEGEIVLGQWQRVLMGELDGPRARTLRLSIVGLA